MVYMLMTPYAWPCPFKVAEIVRQTGKQYVMPRFQCLRNEQIQQKTSNLDLVTEADLAAEAFLTDILPSFLPGSVVLGEEAVHQDPSKMRALNEDAPVWVVDPVDGTLNFARGVTGFAVVLALVYKKQTLMGWIYDPLEEEMAYAEAGSGAYVNTKQLNPTIKQANIPMDTSLCSFNSPLAKKMRPHVGRIRRRGSAAHDYLSLAKSSHDKGMHACVYTRLKPWDHAAGVLIAQEAGCVAGYIDKHPYVPEDGANGYLLTATNSALWDVLSTKIHEVIA
jgi:fructose-1,6-bisphosphatase/inositol monophosphatase family enzyme